MEKMKEILELTWLGNSVASYLTVFFIITAGLAVVKAADKYVFSMIKKMASGVKNGAFDPVVKFGVSTLMPFLYFGVFFAALKILKLGKLAKPVEAAAVIVLTALVLKFLAGLVNHIFETIILKGSRDEGRVKSLKGLSFILKTVIWIIGFIIVLDNLGYKVSTIVAGLGIGGIAVALAAQAILGDLFSYFSIILDKPFETGDFIIVEDTMGTVENIGIKTTRIRSLSGEEVICANSLLTGSKIKNYKRMFNRRVVFTIGVVYGTPKEKLEKIPVIIKGIIESIPEAKFDRSHFAKFGDFSLDFESVYYVEGNDYNRYMDAHQIINFSIYSQFAQEGIEFAYPTQKVFVSKNS
jgi:small-conductance mechanosensitive channel